jgi:galactokinase
MSGSASEPVKDIDLTALAKLCQKAENEYIGVACGIMDQFASAMGKKDHALFLNCKTLAYTHVPLRLDGYRLVIANTNKKRSLYDSKYNERRTECSLGLEILRRSLPETDCLGDITWAQYTQYADTIRDAVIRKRVAHVITEDERVLNSVEALRHNDLSAFGRLMTASHESLRELYEVTGPELDTLVAEALRIDGVLGSRMTGAGFGGCTVSIVKTGAVDRFMHTVGESYRIKTGLKASFYIAETGDGVREVL